MTDPTSHNASETIASETELEEKPTIFDQPDGTDWFLAWLISYADNFGLEQPITVYVGGLVITGQLISGRQYFEETADFILAHDRAKTDDGEPTLMQTMAESYRGFKDVYREQVGDGQEFEVSQPVYLHLRGARVVSGTGNMIPAEGMLWRGKVGEVDGFSLGALSASR